MTLVDKRKRKEFRDVRYDTKEYENGVHRMVFIFLNPADIKGTALLTWQHEDRDDDQWLYLPARGKMQRIAKGGEKSYFMGTDFTYEDLQPETLDDYAYTQLKDDNIEGHLCYVVRAVPADQKRKRRTRLVTPASVLAPLR